MSSRAIRASSNAVAVAAITLRIRSTIWLIPRQRNRSVNIPFCAIEGEVDHNTFLVPSGLSSTLTAGYYSFDRTVGTDPPLQPGSWRVRTRVVPACGLTEVDGADVRVANSRGGTLAILRSAAATKRSSVETRDGPNQVTGYEALLARHVIAAQLLFGPAVSAFSNEQDIA